MNFLHYFESIFGSYPFLFIVTSFSLLLKLYLFISLIKRTIKTTSIQRPWFFLLLILIGGMISDAAWALKLISILFFPQINYAIVKFFIRIAWGFTAIQYQALTLFIESLVVQKFIPSFRQKLNCIISSSFVLFFFSISIIKFNSDISLQIQQIQNILAFYFLFPLIIPSIYIAIHKIKSNVLPQILQKQLKILLQIFIIPHLISEFIQLFPFKLYQFGWITHSYAIVGISTLFLTFAIYYCTKKVMGLRFLNFNSHVQSPINVYFINNFKTILEQLSHVTNLRELGHISQSFFKETFFIPLRKTYLYIRNIETDNALNSLSLDQTTTLVETFISTNESIIKLISKKVQILIYDEIDFTNFYDQKKEYSTILDFLQQINADIFIPVYEKEKLVAYIIVERHARIETFYSDIERDEMIVFASYLGNIINLLRNKSLDILLAQEQTLKKELYCKHQEINQYKESIRSFFCTNTQKEIGIIFYKNKKFIFGNKAAKELIGININIQEGHQLTQAFKRIAQTVETYKAPQNTFTNDIHGNTIIISAVPHLEQNNIIITISYPDVSDIIKQKIDLLKDPTSWDYLLYLQTTKSGKLINKLIPGTGETLLNFKIELLKISLCPKAILLDMPEQDLLPTVELLHHISIRETLLIYNLKNNPDTLACAIKLFGINPIFNIDTKYEEPLLKKLNNTGTLFIKNIHFLPLECQENLAEFIRYGLYKIFKSEQRAPSDVRIICSTNLNLIHLIEEGKFSKALFQELQKTTLSMPSLLTLPTEELNTLADGFTQQALETNEFKNILSLTEKDKNKLAHNRPASLQELKKKVQQILIEKSNKNNIYQEIEFNPSFNVDTPDLIQAARLGKQALKDRTIMTLLWNKFKNQNKIATFLGVNRSSINRRCKEFNLE